MKLTELELILDVLETSHWDGSEWCACSYCGRADDEHEECAYDAAIKFVEYAIEAHDEKT